MALSPWPAATATAARAVATARLRAVITSAPLIRPDGTPDALRETELTVQLNEVGSAAAAMVEREAAGAPQEIKDEAVIRFAGYLYAAIWGDRIESTLGPRTTKFVVNHAPMFRNCGAKGMLAPWKIRRAGAIG